VFMQHCTFVGTVVYRV